MTKSKTEYQKSWGDPILDKLWGPPRMPQRPSRSRKHWTSSENDMLRLLWERGHNARCIASKLGRSSCAVWHHSIDIDLPTRKMGITKRCFCEVSGDNT